MWVQTRQHISLRIIGHGKVNPIVAPTSTFRSESDIFFSFFNCYRFFSVFSFYFSVMANGLLWSCGEWWVATGDAVYIISLGALIFSFYFEHFYGLFKYKSDKLFP